MFVLENTHLTLRTHRLRCSQAVRGVSARTLPAASRRQSPEPRSEEATQRVFLGGDLSTHYARLQSGGTPPPPRSRTPVPVRAKAREDGPHRDRVPLGSQGRARCSPQHEVSRRHPPHIPQRHRSVPPGSERRSCRLLRFGRSRPCSGRKDSFDPRPTSNQVALQGKRRPIRKTPDRPRP